MNLRNTVSWLKERMQISLFPQLAAAFADPMTEKQKRLIAILEVVEIERHIKSPTYQWMGRNRMRHCLSAEGQDDPLPTGGKWFRRYCTKCDGEGVRGGSN